MSALFPYNSRPGEILSLARYMRPLPPNNKSMTDRKPLIGITGDFIKVRDVMPASAAYEVYSRAVNNGAQGLPWIIPPLGPDLDLDAIVERLDGIVFTGARSNVQPHHYDGGPAPDNNPEDPARDSTTLPLVPKVLARGVPMLCICRGMQELNEIGRAHV